jgi:uncharacterized membrane protein YqjE
MVFINMGTLAFGALVFWGISALVGLAYSPAAKWVFIILMVWWALMGCLYTLNRSRAAGRELFD